MNNETAGTIIIITEKKKKNIFHCLIRLACMFLKLFIYFDHFGFKQGTDCKQFGLKYGTDFYHFGLKKGIDFGRFGLAQKG